VTSHFPLAIAILSTAGCSKPVGDRYIVPVACRGWIRVDFGRAAASALPREKGVRVIRIPKSGMTSTSDEVDERISVRHEYLDELGNTVSTGGGMTTGTAASCINGFCTGNLSIIQFVGGQNASGEQIDSAGQPIIGLHCEHRPAGH